MTSNPASQVSGESRESCSARGAPSALFTLSDEHPSRIAARAKIVVARNLIMKRSYLSPKRFSLERKGDALHLQNHFESFGDVWIICTERCRKRRSLPNLSSRKICFCIEFTDEPVQHSKVVPIEIRLRHDIHTFTC